MQENIKTVILYPDLELEINNTECVVNYSYHNFELSEKDKKSIKIQKFIPPKISSLTKFYELLHDLNEISGTQKIEISNTTKTNKYKLMIIIGLPLCIIPPLGLYLLIRGILGLLGFLKEEIVLPKIRITSNFSSPENMKTLNELEDFFHNKDTWNSGTDLKIYEDLVFNDGSKLLLFTYEAKGHYTTHWKYENKDGQPDLRYKNNPSHKSLSHHSIELMIPGIIYRKDYASESEYESFVAKSKKLKSSVKIENIKLGNDITCESTFVETCKNQGANDISKIENIQNSKLLSFSKKRRLLTLLFCFLFGFLGVHRFYVGRKYSGIIQGLFLIIPIILSEKYQGDWFYIFFVICFLWIFIDLILILSGKFKDKDKKYIKEWI